MAATNSIPSLRLQAQNSPPGPSSSCFATTSCCAVAARSCETCPPAQRQRHSMTVCCHTMRYGSLVYQQPRLHAPLPSSWLHTHHQTVAHAYSGQAAPRPPANSYLLPTWQRRFWFVSTSSQHCSLLHSAAGCAGIAALLRTVTPDSTILSTTWKRRLSVLSTSSSIFSPRSNTLSMLSTMMFFTSSTCTSNYSLDFKHEQNLNQWQLWPQARQISTRALHCGF